MADGMKHPLLCHSSDPLKSAIDETHIRWPYGWPPVAGVPAGGLDGGILYKAAKASVEKDLRVDGSAVSFYVFKEEESLAKFPPLAGRS